MEEHYNKRIFDNSELWENYDISGEIKAKLPLIMDNLPSDVASIIDVGCGNGEITNNFPNKYKVLGVDLSEEALTHVKKENICCSCDDISPVKDQSFDMVFSSELIEHLPSELLDRTLREFTRIARKYIFISVPNQEQLPYYHIICPSCHTLFHAYGHLNSFTVEKIHHMLGSKYNILWQTTSGKRARNYNTFLLKLRHELAGKYFAPSKYTICPKCGNREYPEHKGNLLSKILNGLNLLIPARKKDYWLMAIFVRKQ